MAPEEALNLWGDVDQVIAPGTLYAALEGHVPPPRLLAMTPPGSQPPLRRERGHKWLIFIL